MAAAVEEMAARAADAEARAAHRRAREQAKEDARKEKVRRDMMHEPYKPGKPTTAEDLRQHVSEKRKEQVDRPSEQPRVPPR